MNMTKQTFFSFLNLNDLNTNCIVEHVVRNGLLQNFVIILQEALFTNRRNIVYIIDDLSIWAGIIISGFVTIVGLIVLIIKTKLDEIIKAKRILMMEKGVSVFE